MHRSNGIASFVVLGAIFVGCLIVGYVSTRYLGDDNAMENELEKVAEVEAEDLTHMPSGSLKPEIDALFPHKAK